MDHDTCIPELDDVFFWGGGNPQSVSSTVKVMVSVFSSIDYQIWCVKFLLCEVTAKIWFSIINSHESVANYPTFS
jgi:hypothetical protein